MPRASRPTLNDRAVASELSELTAGIAHQVKNPLFAISATVDALESRFSNHAEQTPYFTVIRDSVRRLDELVQELMQYSDPAPLAVSLCDVTGVIQGAVQDCSSLAAKLQVGVVQEHAPVLPRAMVDPHRMRLVFRYLLENALLRSSLGGTVALRSLQEKSGRLMRVRCVVEDSGPALVEQDLRNILRPFFRQRHAGSGLRLATAELIVRQHGGQVTAENRSGSRGLTFFVTIPSAESQNSATELP